MEGAIVWCTAPTRKVWPSGFILAACEAPTVPPAPPLLSMRICTPSWSPTCAARGRANTSVPPPAGNGLIQVIGPAGQPCCARAIAGVASAAAKPSCSARRREVRYVIVNSSQLLFVLSLHRFQHRLKLGMQVPDEEVT